MTIIRRGSINAAGAVDTSRVGATQDINLSLDFGSGAVGTITLERRFNDETDAVANEGDRLMTLGGDVITTLSGDQLFTIGSSDDGFRACDTFTTDYEGIVECVGPTEFRLNCTAFTSGPIEYRLG